MSAANPTVDALPLPATVTLPSFPPALGLSMVPDAVKGVSLRKQLTTAQGLAHCFSAVNATYGDADSRAQGTLFIGLMPMSFCCRCWQAGYRAGRSHHWTWIIGR
ncbi:hypothetical protein [Salinivibrio costicola]|uniref:hypothetical protein n=1 Tax=Salinivibrio costicola TaxID=51367 RepID=UPI00046F8571|nr:hypothetical protein [Salinivibrio costicola]